MNRDNMIWKRYRYYDGYYETSRAARGSDGHGFRSREEAEDWKRDLEQRGYIFLVWEDTVRPESDKPTGWQHR